MDRGVVPARLGYRAFIAQKKKNEFSPSPPRDNHWFASSSNLSLGISEE